MEFTWNNITASSKNVVALEPPTQIKPRQRATKIIIPGRSGALNIGEGDHVYDEIVMMLKCLATPTAVMSDLKAWLSGAGKIVFGNESNRYYNARIDDQIDFIRIARAVEDYREFEIPFICEPHKYEWPATADIEVTVKNTQIDNIGTVDARPRVKIEGSGEMQVTIGGQTVLVDGAAIVDSELMDCYNLAGTQLLNHKMLGEFYTISPGKKTVTWTGSVTKVTITPRWRWL